MTSIVSGTFQVRRDTAANWTASNYILLAGEQGLETDTRKVKFGDGVTSWRNLGYSAGVGTGGASAFTDLTDAVSATIATTNTSVSTALSGKVPTTRTLAGLGLATDRTAAEIKAALVLAKADVGLSNVDNTSDLGKPVSTAVQTQLDLKPTTIAGLSDRLTFDLTANSPLAAALAAKVANDLTASTTVAPSKTAVTAALALKAAILGPISLGTGAIALTAATHANHSCGWTGTTDQTITIDTTGGAVGDIYEVSHDGASGILTFPGTAATGYTLSFGPGVVGQVEWRGGTTFVSLIPNASYAPVSVSGSAVNGSVLTRTLATGWTETGGNWTRDGVNIAGATSSTYTTVSADGAHTVTWKSTTIPFIPTGIAVAAVAPVFTAQSAPAGTVSTAYSYTFVATGAVSYAVASGTVPAGLTLNTGTGVLSGTPTTAAAYTFVISATNTGGTTNSTSQSVTIAAAGATNYALSLTAVAGTWGTSGGRAVCTAMPGSGAATATANPGQADGVFTFVFRGDANYAGGMFRYTDDSNYWMVDLQPGQSVLLIERNAGVQTNRQSTTGGYFTAGADVTCEVTCTGTSIAWKVNGVSQTTETNSFNQTATKVGATTFNGGTLANSQWLSISR